ncbi:hypothetical protein [Streptomyces sp. NPDC000410]|uniref:hypothetical protein n=1 Tax=Streptomyces sp. NPDC000410 TaxID=3154254 RepID=UPI00332A6D43
MSNARVGRPRRSLVIAATALGLTAGGLTLGTSDLFDEKHSSSDTVVGVASQKKAQKNAKKQDPPRGGCLTAWKAYKPSKTFMWQKTSTWVTTENDALKVRFRSMGGESVWRYNHHCKVEKGWVASAGLYQTFAQVPGLYVPATSGWNTSKERCNVKEPKVNHITACFRGKVYTWRP